MRARTAVLAAAAAALVGSVATAVAVIPSSSGTINGCYDPGTASPYALSIVDDPAECKQTLLPFNQTGPTGPAGAAGAPGTIASSHVVSAAVAQVSPDSATYAGSATCPVGEVLLGGGFDADRLPGAFDVIASRPSGKARGWDVKLRWTSPLGGNGLSGILDALDAFQRRLAEAQLEAARHGLPSFLDALGHLGARGHALTGKEETTIRKAVTKTKQATNAAVRASKHLGGAISKFPSETPPTAAAPGEGVYAVCGA